VLKQLSGLLFFDTKIRFGKFVRAVIGSIEDTPGILCRFYAAQTKE
jgi:hypothetical protein